MILKAYLIALIALLLPPAAQARDILMDDPQTEPQWVKPTPAWQEGEVETPERVDPNDLQEFQVDAKGERFRYFIERGSLKTHDDGVTRFALVIRSTSGAVNSSYEGFRCREREYRVYAYGGAERLVPAANSEWLPIPKDESTDYRAALYDDLLCNLLTGRPNRPAAVIRAMQGNRRLNSDHIRNP
ncbi:MAG: CNP1-like family protein [Candidatus Thiodiazotropha sp. (ex Epidulcina cf. delphinae)]|nr:CNP1-like family protein [Candidatus Thiodiazotropha sp. (ex Epidulcina cf. delphinae)]